MKVAMNSLMQTQTLDPRKQHIISLKILALVAQGHKPSEALDMVCGAGSMARIIDAFYAKAGK